MSQRFLIADLHLGHEKTCTEFTRPDGVTPLRPYANADEMDEALIANWNGVVSEKDKVYVLGDVVIKRKSLQTLRRLIGRKVLVAGNHDVFKLKDYLEFFEDIKGCVVLEDMILTHIPLHPDCITPRFKTNTHGHLHARDVMIQRGKRDRIDPRYLCVSVEQTNFTPLSVEDARARIKQRQDLNRV